MKTFQNILVIRTDRMGDVILTTPVLKALRVNFPQARITVLLQPATADLVRGNPFLDQILLDDRRGHHRGMGGFFRLVWQIRSRKFDAVFVFHTKRRTNLLAALAGIPVRIGYRDRNWGRLLTRPLEDERSFGLKHEAAYCMEVLETMGLETVALKPFVPVQEMGEEWGRRLFAANGLTAKRKKIIAVHLGSSDPSKCWPLESFSRILTGMREQSKDFEFILVGSTDVCELARNLKARMDFSIMDLTGQTTVTQLVSVLGRCHLLISNDSGPVHLADALGTPVISIFTRNQPGINPERWRPLGECSRFLAPDPNPEATYRKAGETLVDSRKTVDVQQVLDAVDDIFKVC